LTPPTDEATFAGERGLEIFWCRWRPAGAPRSVVVIAHGAGEHSGRYGHVAARLIREGHAVYALDHRGHGRSGGKRALVDRLDYTVADLDRLVLLARESHADLPVFLLGHSMGGLIALSYTVQHQDRLSGLILSGALAALEAATPTQRAAARVLSAIAPGLGIIAVDPSLVSRDPAVVAAYTSDPLVHHGKLPARTVAELAAAVESLPETVTAITIPTLILYGTADTLALPQGSEMLAERIAAEDLTTKAYDGLYHEILNEPEQDAVLDDVCAWIAAHVGVPV
jgi:alpha-beta hydrolase superfamily lysophospholipase